MKDARGIVVSAKMKRAVVVRLERLVEHPLYGKTVIQRTQVRARDEVGCREGDMVRLEQTRPLSRSIRWRVIAVEGRRALPDAPSDLSGVKP